MRKCAHVLFSAPIRIAVRTGTALSKNQILEE